VYGHEPFITAIEQKPDDDTPRLIYADWLDERADPRGEYLRVEVRLAKLPAGDPAAPDLRRRLRGLRGRIDPDWLARFDQPRVLRANPTPFPAAWWCVSLAGVREFDDTYGQFGYHTLPPLRYPRFTGDFGWLPERTLTHPESAQAADQRTRFASHLTRLEQHLTGRRLVLPPGFGRWLTDRYIYGRMPSCTDCGIDRPWGPATAPAWEGGWLLSFYTDSQGCLTWYLYLTPDGHHAVVCSDGGLCSQFWWEDRQAQPAPLGREYDAGAGVPPVWFVAPSFEAFLYRWWVENAIWYKQAAAADTGDESRFPSVYQPVINFYRTPLTPEQQAYLDFYRAHPATPEPGPDEPEDPDET
jgi:uncharacterized protein (TIGR02996 family)